MTNFPPTMPRRIGHGASDSSRSDEARPLTRELAMDAIAHAAHGDDNGHALPHGWRRYLYSTNHKDIGTMYLVFAMVAGVIGGCASMLIRAELMYPGLQIFHQTHYYDVTVTEHGLI